MHHGHHLLSSDNASVGDKQQTRLQQTYAQVLTMHQQMMQQATSHNNSAANAGSDAQEHAFGDKPGSHVCKLRDLQHKCSTFICRFLFMLAKLL